jgi:Flp pilus assembly protein TadD
MIGVYSLLGQAKTDEALREAKSLTEQFPDDPRAHNLLGNVALALGQLEQARDSLAKEQAIVPNLVSTYLNIAAIDIQLGNLDSARDQLNSALEIEPNSPNIMVSLARLEGRAGDTAAARGWLEKARDAAPAAVSPRIFLARLLLSENDPAAAEAAAREAAALDNMEPLAHNLVGISCERQEKFDEAIEAFQKAIDISPTYPEYKANLVRVQMAAKRFDEAEKTLLGDGDVNLDDIQQASMVAAVRARQDDLEGALAIADALKERHPGTSDPHVIEAELLAAKERYAEASKAYDAAMSISGPTQMLAFRAFLVRKRGNLAEPESPLLSYLQREPSDVEMRRNAAISFLSRKEYGEAIEHFELALTSAPDDVRAMAGLGEALAGSGDTERAKSILERALAESADFPGREEAKRVLESINR